MSKKQIRKFEVVSKYKDKGINLPTRKTKYSCGYDIESAIDITIPSIWKQTFQFVEGNKIKNNKDIDNLVNNRMSKGNSIADIMKEFNLKPILIPTGIKVYMHEDENVEIVSRSSTPMKHGLVVSNSIGQIDGDYVDNPSNEGEMFVQVLNFLPFDVEIKKGTPIAQCIFRKFLVTDDDNADGIRNGGFGSTDK